MSTRTGAVSSAQTAIQGGQVQKSRGSRANQTLHHLLRDGNFANAEIFTSHGKTRVPNIPDVSDLTDVVIPMKPTEMKYSLYLPYLIETIVLTDDDDLVLMCLAGLSLTLMGEVPGRQSGNFPVSSMMQLDNWSETRKDWRTETETATVSQPAQGGTTPVTTTVDKVFIRPPGISANDWVKINLDEFKKRYDRVDAYEASYLVGAYILAMTKNVTPDNLEAFNSKRVRALSAWVDPANISLFVPNSRWLTIEVLRKIGRAANLHMAVRRAFASQLVRLHTRTAPSGLNLPFQRLLEFNRNIGMGNFIIPVRALSKNAEFVKAFSDLKLQMQEVQEAIERIQKEDEATRPFLKFIHGADYQPISADDVPDLLPLCREYLSYLYESMKRYKGPALREPYASRLVQYAADHLTPTIKNDNGEESGSESEGSE